MTDEPRVVMQDIRDAKMCASGARAFFERHGLSWRDFLANGVPCETIEQINDAMGNQVAEVARGRQR